MAIIDSRQLNTLTSLKYPQYFKKTNDGKYFLTEESEKLVSMWIENERKPKQ